MGPGRPAQGLGRQPGGGITEYRIDPTRINHNVTTTTMKNPLFLSSYEYESFSIPRTIHGYRWDTVEGRDCLVCEVDVPINGLKYGSNEASIRVLYLLTRFSDDVRTFKRLTGFPIEVLVLIPKNSKLERPLSLAQFRNIVSATLYDRKTDAETHPELGRV